MDSQDLQTIIKNLQKELNEMSKKIQTLEKLKIELCQHIDSLIFLCHITKDLLLDENETYD